MAFGEAHGVVMAESPHRLLRAEDVVPEWVSAEYDVLEVIVDKVGRGVVIRFYLIAYHLLLLLELMVWEDGMEDHIRQEVNGPCEMLTPYGAVIDCRLLVGICVQLTSELFECPYYL